MDYLKIYNQIIERAKNRILPKEEYREKHHILPKCMGGDNSEENLIELTAKEHFLCHWLLIRIYPENYKLSYAFLAMCNYKENNKNIYKYSIRIYAEARINFSNNIKNNKERSLKLSEKYHSKTEEELKKIAKKKTDSYNSKSEQEKQLMKEKQINYWKNRTEEIKIIRFNKLSKAIGIPTLQFDLNWNFIKEWPSQSIADKELHCDTGAYLKGRTKMAANSYWKYKEDCTKEELTKYKLNIN